MAIERGELAEKLQSALLQLELALKEAATAAAAIRQLGPELVVIEQRVGRIEDAVEGRHVQAATSSPAPPTPILRAAPAAADAVPQAALRMPELRRPFEERLASFRLAFESEPGPLDLRSVDDAVSAHPAVRDVALLDYDGRRATLKVWIEASTPPSEIERALRDEAAHLFPAERGISILALSEVA
jgi:hypothetical protein